MRLFTRRRTVVADAIWRPEDDEIEVADGAEMDDDGCASEEAYGVTFMRDDAPGASLTVWAYVADAGSDVDGDYDIGYRFDYRAEDPGGGEPWTFTEYDCSPESYADWDRANDAAVATAGVLRDPARDPRNAIIPANGTDFFDWDGVPW